jgi:hypothetical protein
MLWARMVYRRGHTGGHALIGRLGAPPPPGNPPVVDGAVLRFDFPLPAVRKARRVFVLGATPRRAENRGGPTRPARPQLGMVAPRRRRYALRLQL